MCILAFSSIYIIQFIEKSFLFNFCEKFVFSSSKEHSLHKAWFENVRSPWEESRGQNENMCGEYGGCVRFVLSENRFATVAQWPRISFATSETVSPLAMWRMVSATPDLEGEGRSPGNWPLAKIFQLYGFGSQGGSSSWPIYFLRI